MNIALNRLFLPYVFMALHAAVLIVSLIYVMQGLNIEDHFLGVKVIFVCGKGSTSFASC